MSEQLVRSAVEAFQAHGLDGILAVADEEIVLRSLLTEAERPLYYGHEGVREWFSNVFGVFPDWNPVPRPPSHDEHGSVVMLPRSSSSGSSAPRRTPSTP